VEDGVFELKWYVDVHVLICSEFTEIIFLLYSKINHGK
jgi:hypothetical protein